MSLDLAVASAFFALPIAFTARWALVGFVVSAFMVATDMYQLSHLFVAWFAVACIGRLLGVQR